MKKGNLTPTEFAQLLHRLADGWNNGNAKQASVCFTEDALYTEPPDKQSYSGRDALFQFFGGESGRAGEMNMTWHHIVFNEENQIGAGEFTFTYGDTVHGSDNNQSEGWFDQQLARILVRFAALMG
jgi:hypothetical protein